MSASTTTPLVGGAPSMAEPAPPMVAAPKRSISLRGRTYGVRGPSIRDPRLHNSLALLVVHICGQVWFNWELSITQILVAWLTCAVIEVVVIARRQHLIAWPAGALLTGNGIALLLRANGTVHGDWWSWNGWYYFFGIAVFAMLTKFLVTLHGRHIFNPSNIALVAGFVVLGTTRVNPQDFWFGPLSVGLVLTYASLLIVGTLVTRRLKLFAIPVGFWLTFTAGLGILAVTGHAMVARWHFGPVESTTFWWTIITSPEVFIFAFFMITDPRTVPQGRVARALFGISVGLASTLLLAPQTTEFNAKVGFLAGLAVINAAWPLVVHRLPAPGSAEDSLSVWLRSLVAGAGDRRLRPAASGVRVGGLAASFSVAALVVVAAGIPARPDRTDTSMLAGRPQVEVGDVPKVEISSELGSVLASVSEADATRMATDALAGLAIEARAVDEGDRALAATAASGDRLAAVRREIGGGPKVTVHDVDAQTATLSIYRSNPKALPRLTLDIAGTAGPQREPFEATLTLALIGDHYLLDDVET